MNLKDDCPIRATGMAADFALAETETIKTEPVCEECGHRRGEHFDVCEVWVADNQMCGCTSFKPSTSQPE